MNSPLFAALLLSSTPAADDNALGREFYDSLVQCAAFHTVEAGMTREGGDSSASHLAVAADFRTDAGKHAPDGQAATADVEVDKVTALYRKMISDGDPKAMAEDWTALESACRDLHQAKAKLSVQPGSR